MSDYITISKTLLHRIVLAANRDDRRIKAVYIIPAINATDDPDGSYMFDYEERTSVADSSY